MLKNLKAVQTLWSREIVRFYRQRSRMVGAIGSPFIFWLLIGSGIGSSFRTQDGSGVDHYSVYFFPGTLLLILLFTAIFSTISLIEDRREGFLQGVLVSPASRFSIVFGKILGAMTLAVLQSFLFLIIAPFLGIPIPFENSFIILGALVLNAFALTSLGFFMAWQFKSIQGFHAVMNLVLFPMWILSGALFPMEGASGWIQMVVKVNPLSYGMKMLHVGFFPEASFSNSETLLLSTLMIFLFGAFLFLGSVWMVSKRTAKNIL